MTGAIYRAATKDDGLRRGRTSRWPARANCNEAWARIAVLFNGPGGWLFFWRCSRLSAFWRRQRCLRTARGSPAVQPSRRHIVRSPGSPGSPGSPRVRISLGHRSACCVCRQRRGLRSQLRWGVTWRHTICRAWWRTILRSDSRRTSDAPGSGSWRGGGGSRSRCRHLGARARFVGSRRFPRWRALTGSATRAVPCVSGGPTDRWDLNKGLLSPGVLPGRAP
jgi:hypothetical protein